MDQLTIRWESTSGRIVYFVDDSPVGEDDVGFDRILDVIRSKSDVKVVLRMSQAGSLGGASLTNSLPFGNRFGELSALAGPNRLSFRFD